MMTTADRHASFRACCHYVYTPYVQAKAGVELTPEQWAEQLAAWLNQPGRGVWWIDDVMASKEAFKTGCREFTDWVIARIVEGRTGA